MMLAGMVGVEVVIVEADILILMCVGVDVDMDVCVDVCVCMCMRVGESVFRCGKLLFHNCIMIRYITELSNQFYIYRTIGVV